MPPSMQRSRVSSAHVHFPTARARLQLQLLSNLKSYTIAEASHGGVDRSAESFSKFKRYIKCNVTENPIGGEGMP